MLGLLAARRGAYGGEVPATYAVVGRVTAERGVTARAAIGGHAPRGAIRGQPAGRTDEMGHQRPLSSGVRVLASGLLPRSSRVRYPVRVALDSLSHKRSPRGLRRRRVSATSGIDNRSLRKSSPGHAGRALV